MSLQNRLKRQIKQKNRELGKLKDQILGLHETICAQQKVIQQHENIISDAETTMEKLRLDKSIERLETETEFSEMFIEEFLDNIDEDQEELNKLIDRYQEVLDQKKDLIQRFNEIDPTPIPVHRLDTFLNDHFTSVPEPFQGHHHAFSSSSSSSDASIYSSFETLVYSFDFIFFSFLFTTFMCFYLLFVSLKHRKKRMKN